MIAAERNYFDFFQLPIQFALDLGELDDRYRKIQAWVHPDKAAHLSEVEKRLCLQWSTFASEAYCTLKRPLERARYLLKLYGVDPEEKSAAPLPREFLLEQIERREAFEQALAERNLKALEQLADHLEAAMGELVEALASLLDVEKNHRRAAELVRQLAFLEALGDKVNQARVAWGE
jgi:molecular chaperone HscB